jgi:hypothetical protein
MIVNALGVGSTILFNAVSDAPEGETLWQMRLTTSELRLTFISIRWF